MKVLYNLLKQYIDFDLNPIELKETFENLGIEVEEFYYLAEGLEGLSLIHISEPTRRS